jgi:hypothetical protein
MMRARKPPPRQGPTYEDASCGAEPVFSFLPEELVVKCERLIKSYHGTPGSPHLADLIWQSEARACIGRYKALNEILWQSAKVKSAKRADDLLCIIAKFILAAEVLANDFAGWGARYPDAMRQAEKVLSKIQFTSTDRLMDHY